MFINTNNIERKTILVTGGTGLVGRALQAVCGNEKEHWVFSSSKDGDLRNYNEAKLIFEKYKPNYVIHLAALVGGLFQNIKFQADFFRDNILINDNVLNLSRLSGVEKVVSCLSTCIFPNNTSYPIDETMIHNGPPHESNYGYAYAKRMIDIANKTMNEQYGSQYTSVIPTNIYGPFDNFNLESSHVIPGLIHKCYLAKKNNTNFVISGSGNPVRQFIYSNDLAKLIIRVLHEYTEISPIILSVPESQEVDIKYVVECIVDAMEFKGIVEWDKTKADGQFKKTACNDKMVKWFGDFEFTKFKQGLKFTIKWFINHYPKATSSDTSTETARI